MKRLPILAALLLLAAAFSTPASACSRQGVPAHAIGPNGKIQVEILFKAGTDKEEAIRWASQFGPARSASRRVPAARLELDCVETMNEIARNPAIKDLGFIPPAPITMPGVTVTN